MTYDICHPVQKCGWVEVNYPVDTAGNNKIWKCYCKTTMCQKIGTMIFNDNLSINENKNNGAIYKQSNTRRLPSSNERNTR